MPTLKDKLLSIDATAIKKKRERLTLELTCTKCKKEFVETITAKEMGIPRFPSRLVNLAVLVRRGKIPEGITTKCPACSEVLDLEIDCSEDAIKYKKRDKKKKLETRHLAKLKKVNRNDR